MAVARTAGTRKSARKARPKRSTRSSAPKTRVPRNGHAETLPGWSDLAKANQRSAANGRKGTFLERISTTRFALLVLALALLSTTYVGHVQATQDLLAEVQHLRRENLHLHLKHNRLKGEFDQMVGPSVIYDRARRLGLEENVVYGPAIAIDE